MIRRSFLDPESRRDLIDLARDGAAAHRLARRANALVLLDDGLSCEAIGKSLPPAWRLVECFKPFLRTLLAVPLPGTTVRRHRDNIGALGGEVISRWQMDSGLRRQPIEQVVLDLIGEDGEPLLSHGQSEAAQRAFDATRRRLFRFMTEPEIGRRCDRRSTAATNRLRH